MLKEKQQLFVGILVHILIILNGVIFLRLQPEQKREMTHIIMDGMVTIMEFGRLLILKVMALR